MLNCSFSSIILSWYLHACPCRSLLSCLFRQPRNWATCTHKLQGRCGSLEVISSSQWFACIFWWNWFSEMAWLELIPNLGRSLTWYKLVFFVSHYLLLDMTFAKQYHFLPDQDFPPINSKINLLRKYTVDFIKAGDTISPFMLNWVYSKSHIWVSMFIKHEKFYLLCFLLHSHIL